LEKEHRLEKSVLIRIFGQKRDEGIEGWRTLHSEELHNLHSSLNSIRTTVLRRMGKVCSTDGKDMK
jgi:hypothetical protein